MINVNRHPDAPTSLSTPEIKSYIQAVIQYLNSPEGKSKPKKPASYRSSDLLEAFDRDFYAKCYLTEQKYVNADAMDVEHFAPQNESPHLAYEWSNLFPAEHYSNMIKPRKTPEGGYLNPCNPNDDVENDIVYTLSSYGDDPCFLPREDSNTKAVNTCNLLDRVHNGHDETTQGGTKALRHAIHRKYIDILNMIVAFRSCENGTQEQFQLKRELKDMLSRKSSFTMLIRSIPAVRQLGDDLLD